MCQQPADAILIAVIIRDNRLFPAASVTTMEGLFHIFAKFQVQNFLYSEKSVQGRMSQLYDKKNLQKTRT